MCSDQQNMYLITLLKNFQQLSWCINNWLWIEYNYKCLSKFHFKQFNQWNRIKYLTMSLLFYLIWRLRWSELYFIPNYYLWINVTIYLQQYLWIGQYFYILLIHVMKQQHVVIQIFSKFAVIFLIIVIMQIIYVNNLPALILQLLHDANLQFHYLKLEKCNYLHLQNLIQLIVQEIQDSLKDRFQQQIKIVRHEQIFLVFIKKLNNFYSIQIYQKNLQTILKYLMNIIKINTWIIRLQLVNYYDCLTNPQCGWSTAITTPSYYNKPCNQIIQQGICSSNPRCSLSATQNICQTFLSCSDLYGVNSGECSNYSIYCAAIQKIFLLLQQNYICAPKPNQCQVTISYGTLGGTTIVSECENTYFILSITNMMIFFYYDYQLIKTKSQINTESIITNNITQITNNKLKLQCVQNYSLIISQYSCCKSQLFLNRKLSKLSNITTNQSLFDCLATSVNYSKFVNDTILLGKCYVAEEHKKPLNGASVAGYCVWYDNLCQTIKNSKQIIDIEVCNLI
ncbi:unnamed protein product [Paramecium primaurelia]|uniref:Transmembrane protein n=1 Tax=Paramecium primaurelia TaxID=5886 RepID=A0A8S1M8X8_PARPR|nr:unnamed protein product [Paramecium primaurelia]